MFHWPMYDALGAAIPILRVVVGAFLVIALLWGMAEFIERERY